MFKLKGHWGSIFRDFSLQVLIVSLYKQTAAITLHLRLSMFPRKQVAIYEDSFSAKGSWMASNVFFFGGEGGGSVRVSSNLSL